MCNSVNKNPKMQHINLTKMFYIKHLLNSFSSYILDLVYSWNTANLIHLIQKHYSCGAITSV